jgi:hypothetical protein
MTRSFRFRDEIDDEMLERELGKLRDAFSIIFLNRMHTLSFGDLYFIVYRLTIGHHGAAVHALVNEVVSEHVRVCDSTEQFWAHIKAISDVCMFLERHPPRDQNNRALIPIVKIAARELSKRKRRALDHLRRIAPIVGKMRLFLLQLHAHVHYKPNGVGEANAKADFESIARQCVWDVPCETLKDTRAVRLR